MTLPQELQQAVDALVAASGMRGAAARELRDDLEAHVREALARGRAPDEILARLGTPDEAGPVLARSARPETRRPDPDGGEPAWRAFLTDLRIALRTLARTPALALTAGTVLALGIAAVTVVFTVTDELLLRPLPVQDQASLVDVWPDVEGGNSFAGFGWQDVEAYQEVDGPLATLAAFAGTRLTLGEGPEAGPVVGQLVSPEYMPMLGLAPALGTLDLPDDGGFGAEPVAVLAHGLWRERFGGDPGVVGRTVVLDGRPVTVVGVGPEGFRGHFIGFPVDLWMPLTAADPFLTGFDPEDRASMPFEMIGRLRPGATPQAAEAALRAVADRLATAHPETHRGHGIGVSPTTGVDHSLRGAVLAFVAILLGVSGLVLLIACLNVGSILLVRTLSREREMAVRLALGAGNGRLVRQMLAEATVLAGLGTAGGVVLALVLNGRLAELLRSLTAGLGLELALDLRVLAVTVLAAGLSAVLAGATPAFHLLRKAPASALRARGGAGGGIRARTVLVVGQVAVSVVLVVATSLFVRALAQGLRADPGFDPDRVASFPVELPREGMAAGAGQGLPVALGQLMDDVRRLPGVEAVSVADASPVGVARSPMTIRVPGIEPPPDRDGWVVDVRRVGGAYLHAVDVPLVAGRDVVPAEAREGPQVAVASEAFVRRFWPDGSGVGRAVEVAGRSVRIVGVARDVRYMVQDPDPDPLLYLSLAGTPPPVARITFRAPSPEQLSGEVRRLAADRFPDRPPPLLTTPREVMGRALLPQRLGAALVGAMGLAALLLAAVGLYGLVRYTVSRDAHELAVRMALGGSRATVLAVVLRKGFLLVLAGTALGLAGAALAAPALSGFLVGVSPTDPVTYGGVAAVFAAVGFLASWLPARRAARIRPAQALRGE